MARGRSIRNKDHTLPKLAFHASKGRLAILRTNPDIAARLNPDGLHVLRVHGQRADNGLILRIVLANVDLLPLFRGATGVHDEALLFHSGSPRPCDGCDHSIRLDTQASPLMCIEQLAQTADQRRWETWQPVRAH